MLSVERAEADVLLVEVELDTANGTAAMLGKNKVGDVLAVSVFVVIIFAVNEHDDISVLLDRTGFAEVREHRNFVIATLDATT